MKRDELTKQVKEQYLSIMASDSQQHFHKTNSGMTPEAYYNKLEKAVINDINIGKFDDCRSGLEIVNKVAADKSILSNW